MLIHSLALHEIQRMIPLGHNPMPASHWENAHLFYGGTDLEWSREYDLRYSKRKIPISVGKIVVYSGISPR